MACGSGPDSTFGGTVPETDAAQPAAGGAQGTGGSTTGAGGRAPICEVPALSACVDFGTLTDSGDVRRVLDCELRCRGQHKTVQPGACDGVTGYLFKEPLACERRDMASVIGTVPSGETMLSDPTVTSTGGLARCCCALCL